MTRSAHPVPFLARAVRTVLAAVLASGAAVVGAAAAHADDDVNWAVATADGDFGSARTSYSYDVAPGSSVSDALVVVNHGSTSIQLEVYAADGFTTTDGVLDVRTRDQTSTAVGAWVQPGSGTVTVPAGQSVQVPFTVAVPQDATPGDHVGAIVTSLVTGDTADGINVDRRLGVRIALRVGGALTPTMAIEHPALHFAGGLAGLTGPATLTYTVHNTGNAVLSAEQSARLTGPFGLFGTQAPQIATTPQLLPGESWTTSVRVPSVVAAIWLSAQLTVSPLLADPSGSTTRLDVVSAGVGTAAVPWLALAVLVAAAGLAVWLLRRRRRSAAGRATREARRVEEAVAAALREREEQEIAVASRPGEAH